MKATKHTHCWSELLAHLFCCHQQKKKVHKKLTVDNTIHLSLTHIDTKSAKIHLVVTRLLNSVLSSQLDKAKRESRLCTDITSDMTTSL